MNRYLNLLILIMTTSCSTYSVSCIHNESGVEQQDADIKDGAACKIHSRDGYTPHLVIETNKPAKPQYNYWFFGGNIL